MENMNAVDIGTWIAIIGFWFKTSQDKANDAKEFGQMKQQIDDLEKRASRVDDQLSKIDSKLSQLVESNTRLETQLGLLLGRRGHRLLETPVDLKR